MSFNRHVSTLVGFLVAATFLQARAAAADETAAANGPSRAAWWLDRDDVRPIADLVNTAEPGSPPKFADRVGKFQVTAKDRALLISGDFPQANVWRFDLTTFDGRFDMRKLYVPYGKCASPDDRAIWTRKFTEMFGDAEKGRTHTGPWEIFSGKWLVPTARVALDGQHVYTSWFDLPSLEDQQAGRVYASFALDVTKPGRHTVRVSFDDFAYATRWRPRNKDDIRPPVTHGRNDLRPHDVGSIAIGIDERTRMLEDLKLKPSLKGRHPRLATSSQARGVAGGRLSLADVEQMIVHVDPDRGELWEYSIDAESMASENDMDAGRKGAAAAVNYDLHVSRLDARAKAEWDRLFYQRFHGFYTFFVFQRNYHPTGYAQNHSSATVVGLVAAGLAWDGPEAEKWLRWGVMTCRKRMELLGRDGGVEWMNEGRSYGLNYFQAPLEAIRHGTGLDLTRGEPFFHDEWRYALHHAFSFPTGAERRPQTARPASGRRAQTNRNVPVPKQHTPQNTPANQHFTDVDQVFMRSDWSEDALRVRLWAGSVFGRKGAPIAKRYNWAHCRVNQGSFVLGKGPSDIILEPGATRTYRKSAANNNCILVNDTDQWGGGQVWHPKLRPGQISRIALFADGDLLAAARADLINAYPQEAKLQSISRCLLHVKPDLFLVFDRLETQGQGRAEWRFHAPFVEPARPSNRFAVFGCAAGARPMRDRSGSYDEAFQKDPAARCEVAFLTPGVKASVAMSDVYYRWSKFSLPPRHLKVVQQSEQPMTLLTAFGSGIPTPAGQNVYRISLGNVSGAIIAGGGSAGDLRSDAHLAIAVHDKRTDRTELMRFGGGQLSYRGVEVNAAAEDVFAVMEKEKVTRIVETIK